MLPRITDEQRQAILEADGSPVYIVDHLTLNKYVIIDADHFDHFVNVLVEHDVDGVELLA